MNAQQMVKGLLEQGGGMGRRGFLQRLGLGVAGAAVAPHIAAGAMARAPAAAAAAAPAAAAGAGVWTVKMQELLGLLKERFVEERVGGAVIDGQLYPPVSKEEALARWAQAEGTFRTHLLNPSPEMIQRLGDPRQSPPMGQAEQAAHEQAQREQPEPQERERIQRDQPLAQPQAAAPRKGVRIWPERVQRQPDEEEEFDEIPESKSSQEFLRGQRGSIKGRPWGMKPGTKGRISRVFKPGQGMGYDAEFRAKGWHPMRVKKGEVDIQPESVNKMKSQNIVTQMLDEVYDEHVKAHELVQKWDKAHASFGKLYALRHKAMGLYREMGRSIAYERALARAGLKKENVSHPITGAAIGQTHNYKVKMPAKVCVRPYCTLKSKPQNPELEDCGQCGDPLQTTQIPIPPSYLRGRLAKHIVGVETNDGRYVWFDEPVPPQPPLEAEEMPQANKPIPAKEFGEQGRLGKWW